MIVPFRRGAAARALLALVAVGCVDTSPLDFVEPAADGGGDAATSMDASVDPACAECVTGADSPCKAQFATCQADEKCGIIAACAVKLGCFAVGAQEKRIACAGPCLAEAGVFAGADPAIALVLDLNVCTINSCSAACGIESP